MNEAAIVDKVFIRSDYGIVGQLPYFQEPDIKNEPMLFSATMDFAAKHCNLARPR